jgi:hypothetical protein
MLTTILCSSPLPPRLRVAEENTADARSCRGLVGPFARIGGLTSPTRLRGLPGGPDANGAVRLERLGKYSKLPTRIVTVPAKAGTALPPAFHAIATLTNDQRFVRRNDGPRLFVGEEVGSGCHGMLARPLKRFPFEFQPWVLCKLGSLSKYSEFTAKPASRLIVIRLSLARSRRTMRLRAICWNAVLAAVSTSAIHSHTIRAISGLRKS